MATKTTILAAVLTAIVLSGCSIPKPPLPDGTRVPVNGQPTEIAVPSAVTVPDFSNDGFGSSAEDTSNGAH